MSAGRRRREEGDAKTKATETTTHRKVRVLVIGDSGAGKTTLTRALVGGGRRGREEHGRTSGCSAEVMRASEEGAEGTTGTRDAATYFVELWDVGGHRQYKRERGIFYDQINGVIIVHDASMRASGARCEAWAREVATRGTFSAPTPTAESFASGEQPCVMYGFGGLPVPCLIVANKVDLESAANDGFGRGDGLLRRALDFFGDKSRRRRSILPETIGEAARASASAAHRRQPSFGATALAKLPPGGGLRTSATLGRIDVDVMHGFFRELVRRRYDAAVIDAGASRTSERLLHAKPAALVDDDLDDLT